MSLSDLQTVLQQQVTQSGSITVNAATITAAHLQPRPNLDTIISGGLVLSTDLTVAVSGSIPAPANGVLAVSGTSNLLGLTSVPIEVSFLSQSDTDPTDVMLDITPSSWTFSDSFPCMIGGPFAFFSLASPHLVLITAANATYSPPQPMAGQTAELTSGLNLVADLGLQQGAVALLNPILSALGVDTSIFFSGPIDATGSSNLATATPEVSLSGVLPVPITGTTQFDLSAPTFNLSSAADAANVVHYGAMLGTMLNVDKAPFAAFYGILTFGSNDVTFALDPVANSLSFGSIASLIGGTDLSTYIPDDLTKSFPGSSISLTGLSATLNTTSMTVLSVGVTIGTTGPAWTTSFFSLDSLELAASIFSPFDSSLRDVQIAFNASAHVFPTIFDGPFTFELAVDVETRDFSVNANYSGSVDLPTLVGGLSDGAISIPDGVANLTFTEFGVGFTKTSDVWTYQLYASAEGTSTVTVGGQPLEATFEVSVDSATQSYGLMGGLHIGDSNFEALASFTSTSATLAGSWQALNDDYLELADIAGAFGFTLPSIPKSLDLGLASASIAWDIKQDTLLLVADSVTYGDAVFALVQQPAAQGSPTQQGGQTQNGAPTTPSYEFLFLLDVDKTFSLSDLPLVGRELAKVENVEVGQIEILICSAVPSSAVISTVNDLINAVNTAESATYPTFPTTPLTGSFVLQAQIAFGNETVPLNLQLGGSSTEAQQAVSSSPATTPAPPTTSTTSTPANSVAVASPATGVTWYTVQKSFGPVSIERIGAMYQSDQQVLWFEIDANFAFGPITLDLVGLGLGSPLDTFSPHFSLQGLGLAYSKPPIEIAGSLTNLAPPGADYVSFEGGVTISTGEFTVTAFGAFSNGGSGNDASGVSNGQDRFTSLFIFGDIAYDFGGPPAFFVTGLALGFGYNSNLRIPTIDQVGGFPFIEVLPTSMVPNTGIFGSANPTPQAVLDTITNTVPPWVSREQGSLWFAAGITFTSFELVNSQALVLVEVGDELIISLVGTSRAQFPQAVAAEIPVYAYIELDLLVEFAPTLGVFSAQAVLAKSSFLLDKACALTGGFAFFVWYGASPHAGDFVLTLGGYNPGFSPPSYYPQVPRVGFHWSLDSSISISGGAYFAFTPSLLMVGGELNATYQSGNLKAWFDAHADIIVQWKPFWFDASIGITIGASYKVDLLFTSFTVTAELGCNLEIWGPPTGGTIGVDWTIISFTIPFGSSKTSSQPVISGWSDVQAMLPNAGTAAAPNVLTLAPSSGLSTNTTSPANQSSQQASQADAATPAPFAAKSSQLEFDTSSALPANKSSQRASQADEAPPAATPAPWIVRGSQFGFTTSSSIPANAASFGQSMSFAGSQFAVAPLGWTEISASHALTIEDEAGNDWSSCFTAVPQFASVPSQLWGVQQSATPTAASQLVANQLVGLKVEVNPPEIGATAGPVDVAANLAHVDLGLVGALIGISGSAKPSGDVASNSQTTIAAISSATTGIASTPATLVRAVIFDALRTLDYATGISDDPMTNFAEQAGSMFSAEPLLVG